MEIKAAVLTDEGRGARAVKSHMHLKLSNRLKQRLSLYKGLQRTNLESLFLIFSSTNRGRLCVEGGGGGGASLREEFLLFLLSFIPRVVFIYLL